MLLVFSEAAYEDWQSLSSIAELNETKARNRDEFIEECRSGKWDGVVAIYRTFHSVAITGRIDEGLIKELPKSVRFVCNNGGSFGSLPFFRLLALLLCDNILMLRDRGDCLDSVDVRALAIAGMNCKGYSARVCLGLEDFALMIERGPSGLGKAVLSTPGRA